MTDRTVLFSSSPSPSGSFLEKFGSPRFIMAPMVGQSELAFRLFCKRYGCQVGYTPMIWSERFTLDEKYREEAFQTTEDDSDRPLIAQFCGDDPQTLLSAALLIQDRCDAIDINLGCPQELAKQNHFGSYLCGRKDWKLVEEIVRTLSRNLRIPVCCKIRKLSEGGTPEKQNQLTLQFAKMLEGAGCALLAVHPRTRVTSSLLTHLLFLSRTLSSPLSSLTSPLTSTGSVSRSFLFHLLILWSLGTKSVW
jgi:tRNA-dihydrouridine synthase 1